jgi:hypothetical protein
MQSLGGEICFWKLPDGRPMHSLAPHSNGGVHEGEGAPKKNTGCGAADPSSLSSLSLPLRAGVAPRSRSSLALAALKHHSRAGCWSRCSILSPAAGRSTTTMPTASRGALHVKHCARLLIPEIDAPIPLDSILPIKSVCMITDVKLMNLIAAVDCSADFSIPNFAILFVIPMF